MSYVFNSKAYKIVTFLLITWEKNFSFKAWASLPANQTTVSPHQVILKLPLGVQMVIDMFIPTEFITMITQQYSTWMDATCH